MYAIAAIITCAILVALWRRERKRTEIQKRDFACPPLSEELRSRAVIYPDIDLESGEVQLFTAPAIFSSSDDAGIFTATGECTLSGCLEDRSHEERKSGRLAVTNRRYVLTQKTRTFSLPFSLIDSVEGFEDGLAIVIDGTAFLAFLSREDALRAQKTISLLSGC